MHFTRLFGAALLLLHITAFAAPLDSSARIVALSTNQEPQPNNMDDTFSWLRVARSQMLDEASEIVVRDNLSDSQEVDVEKSGLLADVVPEDASLSVNESPDSDNATVVVRNEAVSTPPLDGPEQEVDDDSVLLGNTVISADNGRWKSTYQVPPENSIQTSQESSDSQPEDEAPSASTEGEGSIVVTAPKTLAEATASAVMQSKKAREFSSSAFKPLVVLAFTGLTALVTIRSRRATPRDILRQEYSQLATSDDELHFLPF